MFSRIGGAVVLAAILAAAPAVAAPAAPAPAKDIPAGGLTLNEVVAWLQAAGYRAQIVADSDGKSHVSSATQGVDFGVYIYDCNKDGRCGSIQFSAGWARHGTFDVTRMNEWNRDNRWARGYYDKVNDPWLEYDVDLSPGGTYELLNDELALWDSLVPRFIKLYKLNEDIPPPAAAK
jgi:hypothetical protein